MIMITDDNKYDVNMQGQFDVSSFGVKNMVHIFKILRNSLYTKKIAAVVRETICNMYDAHVYGNCIDKPSHIQLPTRLDPTIKFRDYGPGLSPEDIKEIYCNYGESTKRTTNSAIGSFGLGAKSPFAYTESFFVTSYYEGIQYNYNCIIDESQVGQVILLGKKETTEPSGLEVSLMVHPSDFNTFKEEIILYSRFMKVPPTFSDNSVQGSIDHLNTSTNSMYKGSFWELNANRMSGHWIVMGQVPYSFNPGYIKNFPQEFQQLFQRTSVLMHFNIGDVSVPPARETVEYTDKTNAFIIQKLHELMKELKANFEKSFNSEKTLWGVRKVVKNLPSDLKALLNLTNNYFSWKGKTYHTVLELGGLQYQKKEIDKYTKKEVTRNEYFPIKSILCTIPADGTTWRLKEERWASNRVEHENNFGIIFNDLDNATKLNNRIRTYIKTFNLSDQEINRHNFKLYVYFFKEKGDPELFKKLSEDDKFNGVPMFLASQMPETKIVPKPRVKGTTVKGVVVPEEKTKRIYSFVTVNSTSRWSRTPMKDWWSAIEDVKTIDKSKPYIYISKNEIVPEKMGGSTFNDTFVLCNTVAKFYKTDVYAVTPSQEPPTDISLNDFLKEKSSKMTSVEKYFLQNHKERSVLNYFSHINKLDLKIKDSKTFKIIKAFIDLAKEDYEHSDNLMYIFKSMNLFTSQSTSGLADFSTSVNKDMHMFVSSVSERAINEHKEEYENYFNNLVLPDNYISLLKNIGYKI